MKKVAILFSVLLVCNALNAQIIKGDVLLLDSTAQYNTAPACSFAEFGEYMSCIDSNNRISILSIENYELFLYESVDSGSTWTKDTIVTGDEGDLYSAFITTTQGGQRVIIYGINPYYNYGSALSTFNYFKHGTYALLETATGTWTKSTLSPTTTTNNGLLPFAIFVDNAGNIRAYLHQRGWWTYGGYIHEVIFDTSTNTWGTINQIYGYSISIDRGTAWFASVGQEPSGDIFLIYRKQTNNASINEFVLLKQVNGSWSQATPQVLVANFPASYWGWDTSIDDLGHLYFLHSEASGPNGPRLSLAKDGYLATNLYPFTASDTLSAAGFVDVDGDEPIISCFFKNVGKKFYTYDGTNLTQIPGPQFDSPADSAIYHGYMWTPWSMASIANFGNLPYTINYFKESQGRDPVTNAVLEMPFRLVRTWPYVPDTIAKIYYFSLPGMLSSTVDTMNQEITVIMPVGTSVTNIAPDSILISSTASGVSPAVGEPKDFTNPVQYTVTAEDGTSQYSYLVEVQFNVGIDELMAQEIKVFPNPANDILNIELEQIMMSKTPNLDIYNILGEKIMSLELIDQKSQINIEHLDKGIYFVRVYGERFELVRKVIKI